VQIWKTKDGGVDWTATSGFNTVLRFIFTSAAAGTHLSHASSCPKRQMRTRNKSAVVNYLHRVTKVATDDGLKVLKLAFIFTGTLI
jgi:hypothetical protein